MTQREAELEAALRQALIQWACYAQVQTGVQLARVSSPEGDIWRKCFDLLPMEAKNEKEYSK